MVVCVNPDASLSLNELVAEVHPHVEGCWDKMMSENFTMPDISPKLLPGVPNYIVLFYGSFDPPHRGHLAVLNMFRSSLFNATAAIIVPMGDHHVEYKLKPGDIFLPFDFRHQLWVEELRKDNWAYVLRHDDVDAYSLAAKLTEAAAYKGYDLRFVRTGGPDNAACGFKLGCWTMNYTLKTQCKIFSDISRPFEGVLYKGLREGGPPPMLYSHGEWLRVTPRALQDPTLRNTEIDLENLDDVRGPVVWRARRRPEPMEKGEPENICFIVKHRKEGDPASKDDVSSTLIRELVKSLQHGPPTPRRSVMEDLNRMVISWRTVANHIGIDSELRERQRGPIMLFPQETEMADLQS